MKLLEMVEKLPLHNVRETISLNEAKNLLMRLSEPLAQICSIIDQQLQQAQLHEARYICLLL